ncbi:glycosyltransferase family 4 protein [Fulvivirgaceae bacterium PWU4]|uniref:Glycosyltransferase family 4 protein n=1 Tax=Chryseosolibacter histidini TaxID=2782349 RepID=A0AAP2DLG0_9BACT|nr:glycosyltransferase family 4 protein [Chryseosolibacter histidini]MBT1698536.1 glycosyltransferase family 4 protein [Chryseosolibacter histidini]
MRDDKNHIRIFTWHIHGSYLYYLSQGPFEIFVPVNDKKTTGYIGRGTTFPFGDNVHEVPAAEVRNISFDCLLYQTPKNYTVDRFEILSDSQLSLPAIYLEHDPPQQVPTDTRHIIDDPDVTLVHVTHFNKLMWDNGRTPAVVIDHGITMPTATYTGELERGIVVINNLNERGRRLGLDIFLQAREHVPLDLIGMDTEKLGGLGEILHPKLPDFISRYRFFFNPIRYTSLGLAVLEAMMAGVPVVGLATTEMVTVIRDGHSGILHTDIDYLIGRMRELLKDKKLAAHLGAEGRKTAIERFNIDRFNRDWMQLFTRVIGDRRVTSRSENINEMAVH